MRFMSSPATATAASPPLERPPPGAGPNGITAGDYNHDGFLDLATVNASDGTVSVLLGHNDGTFTAETPIPLVAGISPGGPTPGTPNGASAIIGVDINSNGYLDLITANTVQNQVVVLMNNGDGTFQSPQYYSVPNGPAYLAKGDFNRDGKPDLAVTQSTGSAVSVLINNTLPTPVPGRTQLPASNPAAQRQWKHGGCSRGCRLQP